MKKEHTQIDIVHSLIEQIKASKDKNYRDSRLKISISANNNFKFICRYFMPYCTQKLASGNYIFLNRGYKPIGLVYETCNPLIDYETYDNVSFKSNETEDISFYDDSNTPWSNKKNLNLYLKKLENYLTNSTA